MCPVHTFHAHVHVKSKVSLERVVYTDRLLISGGSTDRILRGVIAVKHGATESTVALDQSHSRPPCPERLSDDSGAPHSHRSQLDGCTAVPWGATLYTGAVVCRAVW